MSVAHHRMGSRGGLIAACTTIFVTLCVTAGPAAAATRTPAITIPRLPTQTVVTASETTVATGDTVTLTATVHPVLILADGSVTFTDSTLGTKLGTAKPSLKCLLSLNPCKVTLAIPASSLAQGANTVVAAWSGDLIEAPSSGSIVLTGNFGTVTTCTSNPDGCEGAAYSADGTAYSDIFTQTPATGTETITIGFSTVPLPCTTPNTGDTLVFSVTNAGSYKSIDYDVYGAAADAAEAAHPVDETGGGGHVCYESPTQFTTASGTPATLDPATGLYYGVLPACIGGGGEDQPASNEPCLDDSYFFPSDGEGPDVYGDTFETTQADPRATN